MGNHPTWAEFKSEVTGLMPQDAQRLGLEDYLPRLMRLAVIDLQDFIPAYRNRHEIIYHAQDFATDGAAGVGVLPPSAQLRDCWMFDTATKRRFAVIGFPWERRFELAKSEITELEDLIVPTAASLAAAETAGAVTAAAGNRVGLLAVDPQGAQFYLYPKIEGSFLLSVHWDGRKVDFQEDEQVPFDQDAAQAVADYCKAKIALEVDREQQRHNSFMSEYVLKRTNLYLRNKDKSRL